MAHEVGRAEVGAATIVTRSFPTQNSGTTGEIDVFEGTRQVASMPVPMPGVYDYADGRRFYVGEVTGDDEPDVFVRLMAASFEPWTVVSKDSGDWRRVPFDPVRTGDPTIITSPSVPTHEQFDTMTRICDPDCATGGAQFDVWRYDRSKQAFLATSSVSCAHPDDSCPFPWRDRQPLGSLR